jgi:hypothetical protein
VRQSRERGSSVPESAEGNESSGEVLGRSPCVGARLGLAEQDSGGTRNPTRGVIGIVKSAPIVPAAKNHKAEGMANGEVGSANRYANTRLA